MILNVLCPVRSLFVLNRYELVWSSLISQLDNFTNWTSYLSYVYRIAYGRHISSIEFVDGFVNLYSLENLIKFMSWSNWRQRPKISTWWTQVCDKHLLEIHVTINGRVKGHVNFTYNCSMRVKFSSYAICFSTNHIWPTTWLMMKSLLL